MAETNVITAESKAEQIERLRAMAAGDLTWDLSDNDRAALQSLLTHRDELLAAIRDLVDHGSVDQDDKTLGTYCVCCFSTIDRKAAESTAPDLWSRLIVHEPECSVRLAIVALDNATVQS